MVEAVDLNRLREAREQPFVLLRGHPDLVVEVLDAVLDAPTVWWCWSSVVPKCGPDGVLFDDPEYHTECGPRKLVPVKGES